MSLRFRDGEDEHWLSQGETVVGRGARCELILDDTLVSRRHARFVLDGDRLSLEDIDSVNGVYVNGTKLKAPMMLHAGDRILIGREIFVVHYHDESEQSGSVERVTRRPPAPETRPPPPMLRPTSGEHRLSDAATTTDEGSGLDVLAKLADKVLALGRGDDAEKILSGRLLLVLQGARNGTALPVEACDSAGRCALKLVAATGRAQWFDYLIELYTLARRPWPATVIDELHNVLRRTPLTNLAALREYLRVLQIEAVAWGPAERFLVQRIEGLERTATKQT